MKTRILQFKHPFLTLLLAVTISSMNYAQSCTINPVASVSFAPIIGDPTDCTFTVELCITITINNTRRVTFNNTITSPAGPTLTFIEEGPFPVNSLVCTEFNYILDCDEEPEFTATAVGQTGNGAGSTCDPEVFPPFGLTGPLPVELISFTAHAKKANVTLNWVTASELNNDYFEIERSMDGRSFQKIDRVKGAGTSDITLNYNYKDIKPQKGQNYYRLKQVDFDGTFSFTKMTTAEFVGSVQVVKIIPTHSYGELSVVFFEVFDEHAPIEVFDLVGNRVLTGFLPVGSNEVNFDVSSLNSGQYYIRIRGEEEFITKRFIKIE